MKRVTTRVAPTELATKERSGSRLCEPPLLLPTVDFFCEWTGRRTLAINYNRLRHTTNDSRLKIHLTSKS